MKTNILKSIRLALKKEKTITINRQKLNQPIQLMSQDVSELSR